MKTLASTVLWIQLVLAAAASAQTRPLWTLDTRAPSYGGGAIGDLAGDGNLVIVFGTYFNDEHLYAVRAGDGVLLWKRKSEGGPFDASVALVDLDGDGKLEVLAADSSTGTLFCLNHKGEVLWKHKLPNSTDSPPAVAPLDGDGKPHIVVGVMALGDRHGRVIALDAATRKERWQAKVPGHVQSEPALVDLNGDGVLDAVVTTWRGDKKVRALNGKDGSELWTAQMAGDMYHGVSVIPGKPPRIVAHSIAGDVCLLDAQGKDIWRRKIGGYLFGPTSVGALAGDGKQRIVVPGPRIVVLDLEGNEIWRSPEYGSVPRGVALADLHGDGTLDLFFGASDRKFRILEGKTGKELFAFDATVEGKVFEGIDSAPLIADFKGDGKLAAFFVAGRGLSDKTRPMNYGRAFALPLERGAGAWTMFRGNLRRTGSSK